MARIRTIKPEFFRHETLQDIEEANPGNHCMLVFAGLWTICDKNGVFELKPRHIKLDILPFMSFDMEKTLGILACAGMFSTFEHEGKAYGHIESFNKHQRIEGTEFKNDSRFPDPSTGTDLEYEWNRNGSKEEALGKQTGSKQEAPRQEVGTTEREKEKEGEKERKKPRRKKKQANAFDVAAFVSELEKQDRYLAVDINREVEKMALWLEENPKRKWCKLFIINWLDKAAKDAGPVLDEYGWPIPSDEETARVQKEVEETTKRAIAQGYYHPDGTPLTFAERIALENERNKNKRNTPSA